MATLYEYYDTGDDGYSSYSVGASYYFGQTFTTTVGHYISSVSALLFRSVTQAPGIVTISIFATSAGLPTGTALVTGTTNGNTLTTSTAGEWRETTLSSSYLLNTGTKYAIVIQPQAATDCLRWRNDSSSPTYAGGNAVLFNTIWGGQTFDFMFRVYGVPGPPTDKKYSRKLIAIGNNEVWYESTAGTMTELAAANGDIECGYPLEVIEAYQKLFIVNKTNLKIADFVNTKINTTDAGTVVCTKGMTLTGGTSGASMIVDYVDAITDDAAMNAYGYRTTTATFSSDETVTGTNSAGATVSFATSAAETAPPHWYSWTVFGNDTTTYGTMPTSSSLIALYRGRLVINDNHRPHAWYMTRVENPWKVLYDFSTDGDLSAITYANSKVGEVGDIITALIAYKDDLLIFGCANSVWILVGDPLGSGQLAKVTGTTGIWGAKAWCIDDKSNLYFLGEDGIYRMPISETYSPPENISKLVLPNLLTDLDLDKSLHRVTFGFDPIKYGITISKTLLSDGTNTNYWYDLTTQGFYPESYPTSCGIFSAYYYPATDDTYKKFLVGCTDGYIREFDNPTKNDTTTASTSPISSYYAVTGKLSQDESVEGKLIWLRSTTAGGASGGDFNDTDSISFSLYTANDAETCLENIKDSATAFATGTWTGTGKQNKNIIRMRGCWYGLKLNNSTASETWGINHIIAEVKPAGQLR